MTVLVTFVKLVAKWSCTVGAINTNTFGVKQF